mgnify:CR=1 FL=1
MKPGDFVEELAGHFVDDGDKGGVGYIVDVMQEIGLPPMATVLWSDGRCTTRWQDDLTLIEVSEHTYKIGGTP